VAQHACRCRRHRPRVQVRHLPLPQLTTRAIGWQYTAWQYTNMWLDHERRGGRSSTSQVLVAQQAQRPAFNCRESSQSQSFPSLSSPWGHAKARKLKPQTLATTVLKPGMPSTWRTVLHVSSGVMAKRQSPDPQLAPAVNAARPSGDVTPS